MTLISKMTLNGFKSFAKHTELLFGNGFNCILGPNGSGKSNIFDALCFVLGRMSAKSMRAEKASNLIYNGGKSKSQASHGEVSIFFDNSKKTFPTEEPYVKITRIIKKDSQSIYKINDQKRTRQQVLDMLAVAKIDPEGYNIVLQGDIVRFAEMNTGDRRMLIEEVSGISLYEDKKQKALRELEKVDEKLKEADILLTERNIYLKELKKERDHAQKFKDLKDRIDTSKASYLWIKIEAKQKTRDEMQAEISKHQDKINSINAEISSFKNDIEQKKNEISGITKEIEAKGEKEQVAMQREVEQLKIDVATNKTRIESLKNEIEKISMRKKQLNDDLKDIDSQISQLNKDKNEAEKKKASASKDIAGLEGEIKKFRKDNQIDNAFEIEKEIEKLDKEIEEKQKEIDELRKEQQDSLRQKDQVEFQLNSMKQQIDKVLELEKEHKTQIEALKIKDKDFKKAVLELNILLAQDSILAKKLSDSRAKLYAVEQELAKLNARNISIRESAGDIAVKKILEQKSKDKIRGIYGTVSELGSVKSEYSLALEIAAGPRINSLVVEDDKIARDCIHFLKENKFGVAVFLPLNKIKAKQHHEEVDKLLKEPGVHGKAVELVSYEPKFKKVFEYVFQDTLVVDSIDTARKIGIGKARMVSLDGDLAELSGAMQGGFRERKNRPGFQEKELIKDIESHSARLGELKKDIADIESKRVENEKTIAELREKKAALEGEIIKERKSLHLDDSDLGSTKKSRQELEQKEKEIKKSSDELTKKITDFNKVLTGAKIKKQELREKITSLRNPALLAELTAFEQKKNELSAEVVQIEADLRTINSKINDMRLPEKNKIQEILKQQQKELEEFDAELKRMVEKIKTGSADLKEKEKNLITFRNLHRELFAKRDRLMDEIEKISSKIEGLNVQSRDVEIKMNKISVENAGVVAELAGLSQEFQQYEGIKIDKERSEQELKLDISKFERMASDLGSINMMALEKYEAVEKEYNSLLEKRGTLSREKDEVLIMMNEIEGKKKDLFMRTFEEINKNFKQTFNELFSKGDASLEIENPEKPFEAGVDIKVRLTGSKFLDIRSLSGGEKTMTALAFIFSIQEYEPHSFYILDEVDATLDKHNSDKLSKLIRKYVSKAQYIVISHNDAITTEADNLYGISMDKETQISKVTSIKL